MKILIAVLAFAAFIPAANAHRDDEGTTTTVCIEVNGETICN
jgi:hypothetical protein